MHAGEQTGPSSGERRPGREAEGEGEGTRGRVGRVPVAGLWWPVLVLGPGHGPFPASRVQAPRSRRRWPSTPLTPVSRALSLPSLPWSPRGLPPGSCGSTPSLQIDIPTGAAHFSAVGRAGSDLPVCRTQHAVRRPPAWGGRGALLATAVAPSSSPLQGRKGLPNPNCGFCR